MRRVRGWFWPAAAHLFGMLDEIQKTAGVRGQLFEIGTFHGKSTILLAGMLEPGSEKLGVCDCFGVDEAGSRGGGFFDEFARNVQSHSDRWELIRTFAKPSTRLSVEDTTNDCRFFHIDGDHAAETVCNDLHVAANAVNERGVAVLDDIYNFAWPGVAEGFFRFMRERPGAFVPLCMGFNKLVLCRGPARAMYAEWLTNADRCWEFIPRGPVSLKTVDLCGSETFVFHIPSRKSPDPMRTVLSVLHQHMPGWAEVASRLVGYHAAAMNPN
ncbi:MAG TPA: class I SAM-dependent methyltransferase [Phycisphaerae bacterium]|nr:class I SAM-dependent methyltransferase [Phycisphaerae bacterium]